jgi:hypothetical protein
MTLNVNAATARLSRELDTTETTIAEALVASASLLHTAAVASRDNSEAPVLKAQSALMHLNKMISGLIEARAEALRVHGQLLDIGREMGATESPYCPPKNAVEDSEHRAA